VWAILGDRLRARLGDGRESGVSHEVLSAVAEHRLDPYSAADRLLGEMTGRKGT
jgi:hypothetical protein